MAVGTMARDSDPQGHEPGPRRDRGQILWRIFLNAILVGAFVLPAIFRSWPSPGASLI
jgi:hypothetical protein